MRVAIIITGLLLTSGAGAAEVAIDGILPAISSLGSMWTSNRVVLLVDPLSSPSAVVDARDTSDPEAVLRVTRDAMRKSRRAAQAFVRYYHGARAYGVFISRFESKSNAEANWANSPPDEGTPTVSLSPPVGERLRFGIRQGMHNGLCFLRGRYHISVEGGADLGWEEIKHLARVIDERLLKETPPTEK